ncbi:MAG: heme NO-binding domain-containing protein [Flavobacteriales bacterium]
MYGLVNKAIKDLIVSNHGEESWNEIAKRSDFHDADFVGLRTYEDALTYRLVGNASAVLGADAKDILELFGEYWITYTADEGYGQLMELCGDTFVEFLGNLDMLHHRMNSMMPQLAPPQFTTRNEKENSIELLYRSHREGLTPMLYGLIRGLGKRFGLTCTVEQLSSKGETQDYDLFLISW